MAAVFAVPVGLPAGASASVSFGSTLSRAPLTVPTCTPTCTLQQARFAGALVASPITGVITSWRVRTSGPVPGLALRVLQGATGAGTSGPVNAPAGVGAFRAQLPIAAGDGIGLDLPGGSGSALASDLGLLLTNTSAQGWRPALPDGSTLSPNAFELGLLPDEVQLNATVEPDSDSDTLGDDTQDTCIGTPGPVCADGSSAPPPGLSGGGGSKPGTGGGTGGGGSGGGSPGSTKFRVKIATADQRASRRGRVSIRVACPAGLIAPCSGTLLVETAGKVGSQGKSRARKLRLGGAPFAIASGGSTVAQVQIKGKDLKILRRLRAVTVIAQANTLDGTGHTTTARAVFKLTVR